MSTTLAELAARFGCELHGDGERVVDTVGTLANAGERALSFLANPLYRRYLGSTNAAAVVLDGRYLRDCPVAALVSPYPYATYARIARFLHPLSALEPGIHPTAVVATDVRVPASAHVGPYAVIGAGAQLGEGVVVGPGVTIGTGVRIGAATRLHAKVVIMDDIVIGERCTIYPGAVIGSDGFGYAREDGILVPVPQLGRVVIGDDVDIGANTAIDRGAIEDTVIESGVKLDNHIQIGHNVHIGAHTVISGLCGVSGSTRVGERCAIGGAVLIVGHLSIADDVFVTANSTVMRSIDEPGTYSSSFDADKAERWRRNATRFRRLDEHIKNASRTGKV